MATKVEKRNKRREQTREEYEIKKDKKEIMSKSDHFKWMLFAICLLCLWILAKFSA